MELTNNITKEGLIPFIEQYGVEIYKMVAEARKELGGRYNWRNKYEMMYDKFGDPQFRGDLFYDEYVKIIHKESTVPAAIRYTIRHIGMIAVQRYFAAYIEQEARKKKDAKKADESSTN